MNCCALLILVVVFLDLIPPPSGLCCYEEHYGSQQLLPDWGSPHLLRRFVALVRNAPTPELHASPKCLAPFHQQRR